MVIRFFRILVVLTALVALGFAAPNDTAFAQQKAPKKRATTAPRIPRAKPEKAAPVNERARIQRSDAARHAFARQTGYPNGRPGYVIDHIVPLACGGADTPSNMQWQSAAAAKAKDKTERVGCR